MKITNIKQQQKNSARYSVFLEGKYSFSLGEAALLESKITSGQELSSQQVSEFKKLSADDKLYNRALRYVALRSRSTWEVKNYLERKQASPALVDTTLNKLSNISLIDDTAYARAFVHDRQLLRPTSRRKLIAELRKKRIPDSVITEVVLAADLNDGASLQQIVANKRRQPKFRDDQKLMSYLARQGFSYGDIKNALALEET